MLTKRFQEKRTSNMKDSGCVGPHRKHWRAQFVRERSGVWRFQSARSGVPDVAPPKTSPFDGPRCCWKWTVAESTSQIFRNIEAAIFSPDIERKSKLEEGSLSDLEHFFSIGVKHRYLS